MTYETPHVDLRDFSHAYAGHSRQAGFAAATCQTVAYKGRFTVVVDEDIDPTDLSAVIWAMSTRCDPVTDIDFIRNMFIRLY